MNRRQALGRLRRLLLGGLGLVVPGGEPSREEEVRRMPLPEGDSIFAPAKEELPQTPVSLRHDEATPPSAQAGA
ncbi:MAG: hypothetical protein NZ951_02650 [Dehalococcoidia bacterium]|nr:hypothetical protein [Dehalococcoidia bacterium]MDW8120049.1 hypothetical protein [Chloroflexota bacterium]